MKALTIAGGVGKDAVTRTTQGSQKVTSWPVAVKDGWGQNEKTLWFDCSWWGQRGEKVASYITKGVKITVTGELSTREHEGKTYLTVNVSDVTLQGGGQGNQQSGGYDQSPQGYGSGGRPGGDIDNDSIPFAAEWRV